MNDDEKYEAVISAMSEFTYDWKPENYDDPSKPILKITKSSLGTFDWCNKKYDFSYIQRLPQDQTEAMRKGTVLHNHREDFFNEFDIKKAENMSANEVEEYVVALTPVDEYYDISLNIASFETNRYLEARTENKTDEYLPVCNEGKFDAEITIPKNINPNVNDLYDTNKVSKLIEKINESDEAILSNSLTTRMIKEINPTLNEGYTNTVSFFNSLKPDNPVTVDQGASLPYSEPAIESGLFTFNSTTGASFRDDGDGALQIVVANSSALTILNSNVGTVDYASGNVTISNVTVNAIATGTTIKIFGRSEEADIVGKLNDLVEIKTDDTTVTVKGTRE